MGGKSAMLADLEGDDEDKPSAMLADLGGEDDVPAVNAGPQDVQNLASVMQPAEAQQILATDKGQSVWDTIKGNVQGKGPLELLDTLLNGGGKGNPAAFQSTGEAPRAYEAYMGMASGPLAASTKAGKLAALLNVAKSAGNQAILGGATSVLEGLDSGDDPSALAGRVASGTVGGGAADVGLSVLGAGGRGAGRLLQAAGNKARNVVAGGTAADARKLAENYGVDAIDQGLGGLLEQLSPSPWYGRSSAGHAREIAGQLADEGIHNRELGRQIGEEGADAAMPDIYAAIRDRVDEQALGKMARPVGAGGHAEANAAAGVADDLANLPPPSSFREAIAEKSRLQQQGADGFGGLVDQASGKAAGEAGRIYRDELGSAAQQYADPETASRYLDSNDRFSKLATLNELLQRKSAGEQSGGDFGNALTSTLVGGALGYGAGALGDEKTQAGLTGTGLIGGLAYGTRSGIRQMAGSWGSDVGANILKAGGSMASGVGNTLDALPTGAGIAALSELAGGTRGHESTATVKQALQQNPQQFGQWAAELQQAEQDGTLTEKVNSLLDDEQDFRALLRKMQNGG